MELQFGEKFRLDKKDKAILEQLQANARQSIAQIAKKTKLLIIRPQDDDVVPAEGVKDYVLVSGLEFITLPGNHRFDDPADRANLIKHIIDFLET